MAAKRRKQERQKARPSRSPTGRSGRDRAAEPSELKVAKALFRRGEYDAALRQFEQALRLHPNHLPLLLDAARAFGQRYRLERAQGLLEKAARLAPRRPDVQYLVGESYRMLGRLVEAQSAFEKACHLVDLFPNAQLELAFLYERRHRLDESRQLVDGVLGAQPQRPGALILKARILRRQGQLTPAESILQEVVQLDRIRPVVRAEALGDLAQLYDQLEQYETAWTTILRSKQILLQQDSKPWSAAQIVFGRFGQLAKQVTAEQLSQWTQPPCAEPARVGLLTGFPRSGTTLVEQMLESHPEVISSEEQDVLSAEIFPNLSPDRSHETPVTQVLQQLTPETIAAARARYLVCMEAVLGEPIGSRLHLDKNPAMNLMLPVVLRLFPEMKLLVALRDPRDLVVSCFLRYLPLNPVSVCYLTLERLLERYLLDMTAWLRYRELLAAGWLEVRYEQIVQQTRQEAGRLLEFLDLAWNDSVLDHRHAARRKPVASPTYEDVAKPIYASAIGRWQHYQQQLDPILSRLEPVCRMLGYG